MRKIDFTTLGKMINELGNYMDPIIFKKDSPTIEISDIKFALSKILGDKYNGDKHFSKDMIRYIKNNWLSSNWFIAAEVIVIWKYSKINKESFIIEREPEILTVVPKDISDSEMRKLIKGVGI